MENFITSPITLAKRVWFKGIVDGLVSNGLNKTGIAEKLKISPQRLTNLLNGTDAISDKVIDNIVETLELGIITIKTSINAFQAIPADNIPNNTERIIDRLDRYLILSGITDGQVSANARINGDLLPSTRKSETADISEKIATSIAKALPGLNLQWLLNGTGEMRNENALPTINKKEPMARILDLLEEEGVSLEEFATAVNSNKMLFNNALKWPFDSRNLLLGNDKQIRGWIEAFCDVLPKYSKLWILTGKGSKYNYPIYSDNQ